MEAAARPLKVSRGSFESLQKSLLGLHGGSNGSCSEASEGAKGQFRKPTKNLLGLHGGSNGNCSEAFEGGKGQFRKPTKKLAGPARRQQWKLQRGL